MPVADDSFWDASWSKVSNVHCHQPVKLASYIEISPAGLKTFQVWIWTGIVALIAWKLYWKLRGRGRTFVYFAVNWGDWNEVRKRKDWEKSLPRRGGCYVLAGCKVGDFIGKRDTEQGEGVRVAVGVCQVGEKAE